MPEFDLCWEMGKKFDRPNVLFRVVHARTETGRTVAVTEYFTDAAEVSKRVDWIAAQDSYELVAVDEYRKHEPRES